MDGPGNVTPRLGVVDKRDLFQGLLAMVERLLALNKFPAKQEDFALSLQPLVVEDAWRLLRKTNSPTVSPTADTQFISGGVWFYMHLYPDDPDREDRGYYGNQVFMSIRQGSYPELLGGNRFFPVVHEWAQRQIKLEEQILRAAGVIKAIVHSCNTVGQWKRVSPDLLTFLPDKYQIALKEYTKGSPYPEMSVAPYEIDTMLATLAFAALQPMHKSEEEYKSRSGHYYCPSYTLAAFPRTVEYQSNPNRSLEL